MEKYVGIGRKEAAKKFYDAISGKNSSYITLDSVRALFAIYESEKNGTEIVID